VEIFGGAGREFPHPEIVDDEQRHFGECRLQLGVVVGAAVRA